LKTIPYFNDLLFGNFSEAELKNFDGSIGRDESAAEDYGYYSDSDLGDEEDEKPRQSARTCDEPSAGPFRRPQPLVGENPRHENLPEPANKGKIVRIPDMAFVTFQAFIFYLYTGQIEFAPRGSQKDQSPGATKEQTPLCDKTPLPSSKSVYRLADKYDIPALKALALNHIRGGLRNCDIVAETFSEFTSRYDDIRMACIPHLVSALRNDTAEKTTWMRMCEIIENHFKGDLRHATDTLSLLLKTVSQDDGPTTTTPPSNAHPAVSIHTNNPAGWVTLQMAMAKSIREGVFFDRKYWALSSKEGMLRAVYFSSMFKVNELEACITHLNGETSQTMDFVREMEAESDCESDSIEAEPEETAEVGDGETRTVLSPGSHSAWRSVFFYKFTGRFSFAPLRSQGADSRLKFVFKKTTADSAPPPCSPKNIYILAKLLNIQPLRDLAFKDIESKLSADNIVEEFFSPISARDRQILEMECRLLFSKFKNKATMSLVQEKIGETFGNRFAHRADAFKLGLRAALDLKERDPAVDMMDAVMLRCRSLDCPGHDERIPYTLAMSSRGLCPRCKKFHMQCAGCAHVRMDTNPWCKSCRKLFL